MVPESVGVLENAVPEITEVVMVSSMVPESVGVLENAVPEETEVVIVSSIDAEFCIVFELVKYIRS